MQFIPRGIDIPNTLLQAHEEGRLVFFCGSGISKALGLPDYQQLVCDLMSELKEEFNENEHEAFRKERFDTALDLVERRLPGQRIALRKALVSILKIKTDDQDLFKTHKALLQLSKDKENVTRLVTTNFDRAFHMASTILKEEFGEYRAPHVPIPKRNKWDGIVFLHGLLPQDQSDVLLNQLVLTSGDFGLAYLVERWASRFVSELFRNYEICFIGYSIEDPVIRYMMDAIAADRLLGEKTPTVWAFASYSQEEKEEARREWSTKGVTPVLYTKTSESGHEALHDTLQAWAEVYSKGMLGKESIVSTLCNSLPHKSSIEDDFVGRLVWALIDRSGVPAKVFAEATPLPSIDWLTEVFSKEIFDQTYLRNVGIIPSNEWKGNFSMVRRPAPYYLSSPMHLVNNGYFTQLDAVMFQLGRWLVRHVDNSKLILWVGNNGGKLHEQWKLQIRHELVRRRDFALKSNSVDAVKPEHNSPEDLISYAHYKLWKLILLGKVIPPHQGPSVGDSNLFNWKNRLVEEGLTTMSRIELRELLSPKVVLKEAISWLDEPNSEKTIDFELVLNSTSVRSALTGIPERKWADSLPNLLGEFQQLLLDAMCIQKELGEIDSRVDNSSWHFPSISDHWQNGDRKDWAHLIALLRDSWLEHYKNDVVYASKIAKAWFELPFPVFKRLALFAASKDKCTPPGRWLNWLQRDGNWWLWSDDTKREVCRLITLQGKSLTENQLIKLERAIISGPSDEFHQKGIDSDIIQRYNHKRIFLRLSKLKSSGRELSKNTSKVLNKLRELYPSWSLAGDESDEFVIWVSGTGAPDYDESRFIEKAPRTLPELIIWLKRPVDKNTYYIRDDWRELCQEELELCISAFTALAKDGYWPEHRWNDALYIWSSEKDVKESWSLLIPLIGEMRIATLSLIPQAVSHWLKNASKEINPDLSDLILTVCDKILNLDLDTHTGVKVNGKLNTDPLSEAINHVVGHITQAIINLWLQTSPTDGELIPNKFSFVFTRLCNVDIERFRHARVLMSTRLITFYRVDQVWTERKLLPLLDWRNIIEARANWSGFLANPRLYLPLITAFKTNLILCSKFFDELENYKQNYSAFITHITLNLSKVLSNIETKSLFNTLPLEGLEYAAQAILNSFKGHENEGGKYWSLAVSPFLTNYWPKSISNSSSRISEHFVELAILSGNEFPHAIDTIIDWLVPPDSLRRILSKLSKTNNCREFPEVTLNLLDKIVFNQLWPPQELRYCIDLIVESDKSLLRSHKLVRLMEYYKSHKG